MAALIAVFLAVVSPMQSGDQVSAQNPGAEETIQQSTPESGVEERQDGPECLDDPSLSFCPGPSAPEPERRTPRCSEKPESAGTPLLTRPDT